MSSRRRLLDTVWYIPAEPGTRPIYLRQEGRRAAGQYEKVAWFNAWKPCSHPGKPLEDHFINTSSRLWLNTMDGSAKEQAALPKYDLGKAHPAFKALCRACPLAGRALSGLPDPSPTKCISAMRPFRHLSYAFIRDSPE